MITATRITTPFGAQSTAEEVAEGTDLAGARAVVTGASSGIGVETARVLAAAGAEVTLAVRDVAAGERTAAALGGEGLRVARLDLADQGSVAAFAAAWDGPLDLLVANAGVMALPALERTPEGWERQFATNHLGHFALACGLRGALRAAGAARVVSVSSSAHLRSPVVLEDLEFRFRDYEPWAAYGQSKTANVLFAVEASLRWAPDGITVNAIMPGSIATGLQRHVDPDVLARMRAGATTLRRKTVAQGAATTILCALSPLLEGVGGRYFEDCQEAEVLPARDGAPGTHGVAPYALDAEYARRLWEVSERLVEAAC